MKTIIELESKKYPEKISRTIQFKYGLLHKVDNRIFTKKSISTKLLSSLCEELDDLKYDHDSLSDFFQDRKVSIGPKIHIKSEVERIKSFKSKDINALVLCLPFKCKVPIKTNYHLLPDLGELMFLYRLGKICSEISLHTKYMLKITILEETESLLPVFGATKKECREFQSRLKNFISMLGISKYINYQPLVSLISSNNGTYGKSLRKTTSKILLNSKNHEKDIKSILPTIALSMPSNKLTLEQSRISIFNLSLIYSKLKIKKKILKVAYDYLSFLSLQKQSGFREELFSKSLKFSLCPKKGRIGLRPTVSDTYILPHHGVPIVLNKNGKKQFRISYYLDFLHESQNHQVFEVVNYEDKFLFYEVLC